MPRRKHPYKPPKPTQWKVDERKIDWDIVASDYIDPRITKAMVAKRWGISPTTLRAKMEELGVKRLPGAIKTKTAELLAQHDAAQLEAEQGRLDEDNGGEPENPLSKWEKRYAETPTSGPEGFELLNKYDMDGVVLASATVVKAVVLGQRKSLKLQRDSMEKLLDELYSMYNDERLQVAIDAMLRISNNDEVINAIQRLQDWANLPNKVKVLAQLAAIQKLTIDAERVVYSIEEASKPDTPVSEMATDALYAELVSSTTE